MNVFLLEDDIIQQQRLEKMIRDLVSENKWRIDSMTATSKPSYLLEQLDKTVGPSIYFLDIEIKGEDKRGLEIAADIRKTDPNGVIAFITTHSEFAPVTYAYKVSAYDFIGKEWTPDEIQKHLKECFLHAYKLLDDASIDDLFIFENQSSTFKVLFSDILYFETTSISHKLRLICKNRTIEFYSKLNDIEKMSEHFFKVHRSFVINLKNVSEFNRTDGLVFFTPTILCPVSKRKYTVLTKKLNIIESQSK